MWCDVRLGNVWIKTLRTDCDKTVPRWMYLYGLPFVSGFSIAYYSHSMCQHSRPECKEIISFEDFYHRLHEQKKLVVIFFMLWKEVVEHICDRGSPLKRLTNRSCSQAGFPVLCCFLWPGCRLKSAVRPVVSDRYLQVRAVDEVMVSLSLTEKQGRKLDCRSFNRE